MNWKHSLAGLLLVSGTTLTQAETLKTPYWLEYNGKESLDPISSTRYYDAIQVLYNRLVRQGEQGEPVAALASSWSANASADVWTFTLRPDVKFHNGKTMTPEDVVYSFNRILDPQRDAPARAALSMIKQVTGTEDGKVIFTLSQAHADLPILLMDYRAKIVPAGFDEDPALMGVGTGPFQLTRFEPKGTTTFDAFNNYWEGQPKLDGMELIAIADENARTQALLAGQIDWAGWNGVNGQQLRMFEGNARFHYDAIPTGDWRGIVFRNDDPALKDARVRKALRMVVDRQEMVQLLFGQGGATISCDNPVWAGDQYRLEQHCEQDIEGAKSLLREAGYPDGLTLDLYTSPADGYFRPMSEIYQRQAARAGIKVNIRTVPASDYWSTAWMKKSVFNTAWGQRPADQVLSEVFGSTAPWNESAFKNAEFDQLLSQARQETDHNKRAQLYQSAQRLLSEQSGTLIPFHLNNNRVMRANVSIPAVEHFAIRWHLVDKS
ncbi:ABC transporter substrate-binding protein [Oceanimonas baumannii]|uniref:ABC transporter substrate-binding protein n=1 Tax=Oceanimonas baumannii TaxID=129578 RepID=UPI001D186310|nr:ABC transporter substrate-binding protein [Oceanimonas baumannii]MCC4265286.1 ABC transporter substrate-binding protein [Oceanimonas baumannii]